MLSTDVSHIVKALTNRWCRVPENTAIRKISFDAIDASWDTERARGSRTTVSTLQRPSKLPVPSPNIIRCI
jgi:hypothetical protein